MEVKVGQVWRTKSDDLDDVDFEILCIGKSNAIVNMMYSDGHLECCKNIRHIQLSADLIKDSDTGLSDLEIVQKALEKVNRSTGNNITLTRYAGGDWAVEELIEGSRKDEKITIYTTSSTKDLLTWAKQTIGDES